MNYNFEYAYIPIGVPTFHLESAQKEFERSAEMLKKIDGNVKIPDEMLLSIDKLNAFLGTIKPDLLIVQNITFANSAYISEVIKRFDCPILLWTLREPVIDGGRLRLNSLTGAFSAGNTIKNYGRNFDYIFGSPNEEAVEKKVSVVLKAARLKKAMRSLNFLQIGHTPQGFGFGRADDLEMLKSFGINLLSIEARELIDAAKGYTDEEIADYLADAKGRIDGLENTPEKNRNDFARLYKAYADYCRQNRIGAVSSRCWPDFFTAFGTPVCAVLAMLNDLGIPAACEADTYGGLSMYIGQFLTERPTFFGDPVSMDEAENTITFWHCGTAACSLAREDTGACADVHCNRKIGPTLDFGCKANDSATIFRIGKNAEGKFRMFVSSGEIPDKPKQFNGTSLVVKPKNNAAEIINSAVVDGWEPHFAVIYGDVCEEIKSLAGMLGIEVFGY
ncbi:MAG: fucose isomerase [Ruminococcus sp.]|nr:fucose isomerase [Ruminococcus sp.]